MENNALFFIKKDSSEKMVLKRMMVLYRGRYNTVFLFDAVYKSRQRIQDEFNSISAMAVTQSKPAGRDKTEMRC